MAFVIRAPCRAGWKDSAGNWVESGRPNGHVIDINGDWDSVIRRAKLFDTAIEAADYYRDVFLARKNQFNYTAIYIVEVSVKVILDKCAKAPTMTL